MFSIKCLKLVKALHEQECDGYRPTYDPFDSWENNIGECQSYFYGVCELEYDQKLPCFGCIRFYH